MSESAVREESVDAPHQGQLLPFAPAQGARASQTVELEGWGRYPRITAHVDAAEDLHAASRDAVLSRGLGRAYSDAALPPEGSTRRVVVTPRADRILAFDESTGVLRAEAGLSLSTLRNIFLPRGFFTPVSTGTRHVTLGGMVASDVHGKNHHVAGCFGRHVRALSIRTGDGRVLEATPQQHADLFHAAQGGMGLLGHVLEVEVTLERLPSPWIYEESERFGSLSAVVDALRDASAAWPMTVAWVDTSAKGGKAGRGIVQRGRWATADEAPKQPPKVKGAIAFPFQLPSGLVGPLTIGMMNTVWYTRHGSGQHKRIVHPESFYWPLDGIGAWNIAYGKRGFTQYSCVLPDGHMYAELLSIFRKHGGSSFVTVFKDCGAEGRGQLSFPSKGTSIALDIPLGNLEHVRKLCHEMNAYVIANGGRIYLAKDAFTTRDDFARMYPRLEEWKAVRRKYDPEGRIDSAQARRLGL